MCSVRIVLTRERCSLYHNLFIFVYTVYYVLRVCDTLLLLSCIIIIFII